MHRIRIWEATYLEINNSRRIIQTRMIFWIQVWEAQEAFKEPQGSSLTIPLQLQVSRSYRSSTSWIKMDEGTQSDRWAEHLEEESNNWAWCRQATLQRKTKWIMTYWIAVLSRIRTSIEEKISTFWTLDRIQPNRPCWAERPPCRAKEMSKMATKSKSKKHKIRIWNKRLLDSSTTSTTWTWGIMNLLRRMISREEALIDKDLKYKAWS